MRILNINDRNTMLKLLHKYGIEQKTVKNRKMGFLRNHVEAVALLEQQKKEAKEKSPASHNKMYKD